MQNVTVRTEELLAKLRENRARHRTVFEAAMAGWREKVIASLEQKAADLRAGNMPRLMIDLERPEDHTEDYERIIAMAEMSVSDTFTMDEHSFGCYVRDTWRWKGEFVRTSMSYAANTTLANYGSSPEEG